MPPREKPRLNSLRHIQRRPGFDDDYRAHETTIIPTSDLELARLETDDVEKARRFGAKPMISSRPHVESTLGNAMVTVGLEIDLLRKRAMEAHGLGEGISYEEQKWLVKLIESMTRLTREIRLQELHEAGETQELTDEELLDQLGTAREVLSGGE